MPKIRLTYANVVATLCLVALAGACAIGAVAQSGTQRIAACYVKKGAKKGPLLDRAGPGAQIRLSGRTLQRGFAAVLKDSAELTGS